MKWKKATDEDGYIVPRVIVCDADPQYRIARFTIDGADLYRPTCRGEFLGAAPFDTLKEAQQVCERHRQINSPTQSDER